MILRPCNSGMPPSPKIEITARRNSPVQPPSSRVPALAANKACISVTGSACLHFSNTDELIRTHTKLRTWLLLSGRIAGGDYSNAEGNPEQRPIWYVFFRIIERSSRYVALRISAPFRTRSPLHNIDFVRSRNMTGMCSGTCQTYSKE